MAKKTKTKKTIDEAREFISDESWIPEAIEEVDKELEKIDSAKPEEIRLVKITPKLPFDAWFDKMLKNGKVKSWQRAAILTFFKKNSLSTPEAEDKYQECFKKF